MMLRTPECLVCRKRRWTVPFGNMPDMLGFKGRLGMVWICKRCLIEIGSQTDREKAEKMLEGIDYGKAL